MFISCGEALIDFVPARSVDGDPAYRPCVGGSPFNVAMTAGRLGASVGYLGRLSTDMFGDTIMAELARSRVADRFVERSVDPSTLSFVSLPTDGEPRYAFFGAGAADRLLSMVHARTVLADPDVTCLHFGSFSLAVAPVGDVLGRLMAEATSNRIVSLDPNIRPGLIEDRDRYTRSLADWVGQADIVKVSQADIEWLRPDADPLSVARDWSQQGPTAVVVTRGAEGAVVYRNGESVFDRRPGKPVQVIDTVGAGDSFQGAMLVALQRDGLLKDKAVFRAMDDAGLARAVDFAISVAGITCGRQGADPPWSEDLPNN
ncbi:carbohydrate kinase [Fodinicurvata sp. EGI_FJ10296]|uniref:carbohydrate kinase family protein n=1 Tax=Fodinicurvata sp. EGI_FJ10296 TaxID=3231908 RepID=UPI003451F08A